MLGDEFGTASNIKSRVNRQSVLGAITSAQQRLKLYNKVCLFSTSCAVTMCHIQQLCNGECLTFSSIDTLQPKLHACCYQRQLLVC